MGKGTSSKLPFCTTLIGPARAPPASARTAASASGNTEPFMSISIGSAVRDGAKSLTVVNRGVVSAAEIHEERLRRLRDSARIDGDADGPGRLARGERQRAAGGLVIGVAAGAGRRAVRRGVVDRHRL